MIRLVLLALLALLFAVPAKAASLVWDQPSTGTVTIEYSAAEAGPFTVIARDVPAVPKVWPIPARQWGYYKITNASGISNLSRYSLDINTDGLAERLTAIESRLATVEAPPPPAPASNLTIRQIDGDHVEILCANSLSMRSTGSGLRRIVECVH